MPRSYSSDHDAESGYASGSSSASLPEVYFSRPHLKFINQQLAKLEPQDVLKWCITSLPRLFQTTAFGLTGLAINDMIAKLDGPIKPDVALIYLDTREYLVKRNPQSGILTLIQFTPSLKLTNFLRTSRERTLT